MCTLVRVHTGVSVVLQLLDIIMLVLITRLSSRIDTGYCLCPVALTGECVDLPPPSIVTADKGLATGDGCMRNIAYHNFLALSQTRNFWLSHW